MVAAAAPLVVSKEVVIAAGAVAVASGIAALEENRRSAHRNAGSSLSTEPTGDAETSKDSECESASHFAWTNSHLPSA